ncbi:OLC1v1029888C1 [Oldenlandia corymbosa var. corymbosa]|uniref:OLC1v1029888C1 n=1 Tax=Oldenlandia corymbosa var. corymbosa TaxID=529605 RepID=A0AAV1CHW4_OLDCO|nr:OLC1v1029888C1 [Oldenlandia corymbosa var. corymbosa]
MVEKSHVLPPPAIPQISNRKSDEADYSWPLRIYSKVRSFPHHKASTCSKCFLFFYTLIVLLCLAGIVLALYIIRIDYPKLELDSVQVRVHKYSRVGNSVSVNMTMGAGMKVSNRNFGAFKFQKGSISVAYENTTLGTKSIGGGIVKGRKRCGMNVFVQVSSQKVNIVRDDLFNGSDDLMKLKSYAELRGIFANLMGKRSAFDDSDEEEHYPEARPQGTPQQEMGQTPSSQMTRMRAESSRKRNHSSQTSGHQKRKRGDPEVVEVDPLSFSLPAIHELSSIDELLKEGYEDQGRGAGQFEGVPEGHALLTFDPPRVECTDLPATRVPRLEDGMRQAVQAVNSFVSVCADLEGQLASAQEEGRQQGQQSPRGRDAALVLGGREGVTGGGGHEDEGAARRHGTDP